MMAYNYFPQNYQMPAYYPQVQQPQMPGTQMSLANQPQQQASTDIKWVQGEAGAKRDAMGRYSSEGGVDEHTKEELRKLIEKM